jgi:hypothetical protein
MGIDHIFVDENHYPNKNKIRIIEFKLLFIGQLALLIFGKFIHPLIFYSDLSVCFRKNIASAQYILRLICLKKNKKDNTYDFSVQNADTGYYRTSGMEKSCCSVNLYLFEVSRCNTGRFGLRQLLSIRVQG